LGRTPDSGSKAKIFGLKQVVRSAGFLLRTRRCRWPAWSGSIERCRTSFSRK